VLEVDCISSKLVSICFLGEDDITGLSDKLSGRLYSERDRTICNAMFSKDFNTHSFEREVKPSSTPSTSGCSWQQSHLKVTEKGFSFQVNYYLQFQNPIQDSCFEKNI
jgi:hypothetical protein